MTTASVHAILLQHKLRQGTPLHTYRHHPNLFLVANCVAASLTKRGSSNYTCNENVARSCGMNTRHIMMFHLLPRPFAHKYTMSQHVWTGNESSTRTDRARGLFGPQLFRNCANSASRYLAHSNDTSALKLIACFDLYRIFPHITVFFLGSPALLYGRQGRCHEIARAPA